MMKFINFEMDKLQETIAFMNFADLKTKPKYIIMSKKTFESLEATDPMRGMWCIGYTYDELFGLKIAICEALPFGEVDIV